MKHQRLLVTAIATLIGTSALSACGQKGPLYLPNDRPQALVSKAPTDNLPRHLNANLIHVTLF